MAATDPELGTPWAYANHMFDMTQVAGRTAALICVAYTEPSLNGAIVDAVVMADAATGSALPTADGDPFFSWFDTLGTLSTDAADGIFNIQFHALLEAENPEDEASQQYHQNGLVRFQAKDGTWVLAATHKIHGEAVLIKDPWSYTSSEGGGTILQRFGTPGIWGGSQITGYHHFGMAETEGPISSVHNIHYTAYPDGSETLALFVNSQVSSIIF